MYINHTAFNVEIRVFSQRKSSSFALFLYNRETNVSLSEGQNFLSSLWCEQSQNDPQVKLKLFIFTQMYYSDQKNIL